MIEKYEFKGEEAGVSLLVLAAIHGNETAGTNAAFKVIKELNSGELKLKSGRLTLVPICNPEAYKKDERCVEENLNRVITYHANPKTYEQKLANEIYPLIQNHQIMLDLHSTHCVGDVPFAFCDYPNEDNQKLISALEVDFVLEGWPKIYSGESAIQDFSTEQCAHILGNTGTTVECGYHKSPAAVDLAYKAIKSTLAVFGLIEHNQLKTHPKKHIQMDSYVLKTKEGKLCKNYKHLDPISRGEKIAVYADGEELYAPADGFILLPNSQADINTEWYYLGH